MIIDTLHAPTILTEQDFGLPGAEEEAATDEAFPEAEALKKYELVQKLVALKNRLQVSNIHDENLETVLNFASELSYTTLLVLSNEIADRLKSQISELEANDQKQAE
jgi:hypothetical protein